MTEITQTCPKGLLHPPCDGAGHFADESCDEHDQDLAWARACNTSSLNAEMLIADKSTSADWVWVFDPQRVDDPSTPGAGILRGEAPTTGAERWSRPAGKMTPHYRDDAGRAYDSEECAAIAAWLRAEGQWRNSR